MKKHYKIISITSKAAFNLEVLGTVLAKSRLETAQLSQLYHDLVMKTNLFFFQIQIHGSANILHYKFQEQIKKKKANHEETSLASFLYWMKIYTEGGHIQK